MIAAFVVGIAPLTGFMIGLIEATTITMIVTRTITLLTIAALQRLTKTLRTEALLVVRLTIAGTILVVGRTRRSERRTLLTDGTLDTWTG